MDKLVSFSEIVSKGEDGLWCDGIALVEVENGNLSISNIYNPNNNEFGGDITGYPIDIKGNLRKFAKVTKVDYEAAIKLINEKGNYIVSSISKMYITPIRSVTVGSNVFHNSDGKIIMNDKDKFISIEEVNHYEFISEIEKENIWLTFHLEWE